MSNNTDLDLYFNIHPIKKDLSLATGTQAIIKSVKNLILMNHYESPFHPEIGSNIRSLLFEPTNFLTANYIDKEIRNTIRNFETRVTIQNLNVNITPDENAYSIVMQFSTIDLPTPISIDFLLTRLR
jgi:phage baseplate assembly protein W